MAADGDEQLGRRRVDRGREQEPAADQPQARRGVAGGLEGEPVVGE